ncbi:MAG: hypothetical protein KJ077_09560 [Anaerolineae bacterium]|nr:hypothetical protein [Anaerolineae bacterium]
MALFLKYRFEICIFICLLGCYAYFFPRWADWNQNSRLDQVLAVVDQRVLYIDAYRANTGDYAFYEGHYYSDKAPGTAFIGIPLYMIFKISLQPLLDNLMSPIQESSSFDSTLRDEGTGITADKVRFALLLYFVTFFSVSIPSAALGVTLYRFLGNFSQVELYKIGITLAYGLGTIAFPYSGLFLGHQLAASLLFIAFYILFGWQGRPIGKKELVIVGLLLGYAVITEYPTAIIAVCLFIYALYQLNKKPQIFWVIGGGLLPAVLAMLYNYSIFQTPLPVAYKYSVLFPEHFDSGILGFSYLRPDALWGMSFSPFRGLFFLSPFLLLSIPGFLLWLVSGKYRAELVVVFSSVVSFFLFISSTAAWSGGFAVGPRYLCALVPFLVLPQIFFLEHFGKRWSDNLFLGLALASIVLVWIQTTSGQQFPDYSLNPLLDYSLPRLLSGDIARNLGMMLGFSRWYSLLPLFAFICGAGGILWLSTRKFQVSRKALA